MRKIILERFCAARGLEEVQDLKYGMDFRLPQFRRECFLRFYEFHLRYRAHPGCVYSIFPFIFESLKMTPEERLWFCFINGNTQHPITSLRIFFQFPDFKTPKKEIEAWFYYKYQDLEFDSDRRHHKKSFPQSLESYQKCVGDSQVKFFEKFQQKEPYENFDELFKKVSEEFYSFGRLSTFSYLEYLKIAGIKIDCSSLFLEDIHGSHSQRNGLCKVLGRDDIDLHQSNPTFEGYDKSEIEWLISEGEILLSEAKSRFINFDFYNDVSYFTLESTLCTFKSFHRPNRRYPGVYLDMFQGRYSRFKNTLFRAGTNEAEIDKLVLKWRSGVRKELRTECVPGDVGLAPEKQNHYLNTGQHIMMNIDWPCFKNDYNDRLIEKNEGELL